MANTSQTFDQLQQLIYKAKSGRLNQTEVNEFASFTYQMRPIHLSYKELVQLRDKELLIPETKYVIEDYQLLHYLNYTSELRQAEPEKIQLTALSESEFKPAGRSLDFPNDIVYFDFDGDTANPDQVPVDHEDFKGYIYRRFDEANDNDIAFDYRNVKFRRWKMDSASAAKLGLNSNVPYLPRPTMKVGWEYGAPWTGSGDDSFDPSDHVIELNAADVDNEYEDFYPFYDSRDPKNYAEGSLFEYNYIRFANVKGVKDDGTGVEFDGTQGQIGKWNLPNFVVLPIDDSETQASVADFWGISINTDRFGDFTIATRKPGVFDAQGFSFMNFIIAGTGGKRAMLQGKIGNFRSNVVTVFAGGPSFEEGGLVNSLILGFTKFDNTYKGTNFGFSYIPSDSNGDIVNSKGFGYAFGLNTIYDMSVFQTKTDDGGFPQSQNSYFRGIVKTDWGGDGYSNVFIKNKNVANSFVDLSFLKKSDAEKKLDIDTSDNSVTLQTYTAYSASNDGGDNTFYGVLRITSGSVLEKVVNSPRFDSFQIVPDSGVSIDVTHNTEGNGIRLKSSLQPSLTLNGDNGDFCECVHLNGNIVVDKYYQF
jgi:hypothetical protein